VFLRIHHLNMCAETGERGRASLEFLTASIVLLIPVMFLGMSLSSLHNASLAAEAAARNAARVFVKETSVVVAANRAQTAVAVALGNHGIDQALSIQRFCSSPSCLQPGSVVTIRVGVEVSLISSPFLPRAFSTPSVPIFAEATAMVSRYGGAP
jgi:hypothetical protein